MVWLTIFNSRASVSPAVCSQPSPLLAPVPSKPLERLSPLQCGNAGPHDRSFQAALGPRGILLENQDVGTDVQRRMGKPVRRLRAVLPGKARGRGYRQDRKSV